MVTSVAVSHPFLRRDALSLGFTRAQFDDALHEGQVRRILHRVYVDAQVPDSTDLRIAALHLIMPPHAVLYGTTAMWALGVDAFQPEERYVPVPRCLVPHGTTRVETQGTITVEGYLDSADVTVHGGLRMTTPARTTVDGLRRLRRPFALSAADAMAHAGWVNPAELEERVGKLRRYPGIVQARSLVRMVDPRTEWPGESWTKLRLVDSGAPLPQSQLWVVDVRGRRGCLDLGYRHAKVGCEYDGREVHTVDEDREADAGRRQWMREALDWRIAVATKSNVFCRESSFELEVAGWLKYDPLPRLW